MSALDDQAPSNWMNRSHQKRLWKDGLKGPFEFGTRNSERGIAQPGLSAPAFGSDWAQLLTDTQPSPLNSQPTAAPLEKQRRFIPPLQPSAFILQPFLAAPIKGSLAQFLYINWNRVGFTRNAVN